MRFVKMFFVAILFSAGFAFAQDAAPTTQLTELQQLKAQVFSLKAQLAQCQATLADRESRLASFSLTSERDALAKEFLNQYKAAPGSTWDWATMTPIPPKEMKK